MGGQGLGAGGHGLGEHRADIQQVTAHAGPLRALPGKHQHHTPLDVMGGAGDHPGALPPLRQRGKPLAELGRGRGQDHRPVGQRGPAGGQHPPHPGHLQPGVLGGEGGQPVCLGPQARR